jgi:hypothetical protein
MGKVATAMNEAIDRAARQIDQFEAEGLVSAEVATRGREFVQQVFTPESVYCGIAPDNGDLTFYWVAGEQYISADLFLDGWNWTHICTNELDRIWQGDDPPYDHLREHLALFSASVEKANPAWREQED